MCRGAFFFLIFLSHFWSLLGGLETSAKLPRLHGGQGQLILFALKVILHTFTYFRSLFLIFQYFSSSNYLL